MKEKIVVFYSTNRSRSYQTDFNKHIKKTIGKCNFDIDVLENDGSISLTTAYNDFWSRHNNSDSVLVVCHHDIKFKTSGWGQNILNIFNSNDVDILGVAGTEELHPHCVWWTDEINQFNSSKLWGKVWHFYNKKTWKSDFTTHLKKCSKVQSVVVLDGVFLAFNPLSCLPFDEDFSGFHFYDIPFCLNNFVNGKKLRVTETIQIVHESPGFTNATWEENRIKMMNKYKDCFSEKGKLEICK